MPCLHLHLKKLISWQGDGSNVTPLCSHCNLNWNSLKVETYRSIEATEVSARHAGPAQGPFQSAAVGNVSLATCMDQRQISGGPKPLQVDPMCSTEFSSFWRPSRKWEARHGSRTLHSPPLCLGTNRGNRVCLIHLTGRSQGESVCSERRHPLPLLLSFT